MIHTDKIQYIDVDFHNADDLELLHRFYEEVYVVGFPDEDERESLSNMIEQGLRMSPEGRNIYHCVIAFTEEVIIGGAIGDYFSDCECAAVEFLVVHPDARGKGLSNGVLNRLIASFRADAKRNGSGLECFYFETENPWKVTIERKLDCIKRWLALDRLVTGILDWEYVQPPLEEGKNAIDYLSLGIKVFDTEKIYPKVSGEKVQKFLQYYFHWAFKREGEKLKEGYRLESSLSEKEIEIRGIKELIKQTEGLSFRYTVAEDLLQIRHLVEQRFGNRDDYGVYDKLEGRYLVAVTEDAEIVAMTGLIDSKAYLGLEVDWTCLKKEYEGRGLVTAMLGHLLQKTKQDVYCSCWRWKGKSIHLKGAMKRLGFVPVMEPRVIYHSEYTNCKQICVAYEPDGGCCTCCEDLYVRRKK
ncbi:MAG: GNAT family N-acetyltransferase [Lachnospiraceae bacterium]|nr:GNAT family N-acetyltransferase [Lachnospiraceae bacterium]